MPYFQYCSEMEEAEYCDHTNDRRIIEVKPLQKQFDNPSEPLKPVTGLPQQLTACAIG